MSVRYIIQYRPKDDTRSEWTNATLSPRHKGPYASIAAAREGLVLEAEDTFVKFSSDPDGEDPVMWAIKRAIMLSEAKPRQVFGVGPYDHRIVNVGSHDT